MPNWHQQEITQQNSITVPSINAAKRRDRILKAGPVDPILLFESPQFVAAGSTQNLIGLGSHSICQQKLELKLQV
jgi:hypothetical protein